MSVRLTGGPAPSMKLLNESDVLNQVCLWENPKARGFGNTDVRPLFQLGVGPGRLPRDLEMFGNYWFVSDKLKSLLERLDPAGVEFIPCDTVLKSGEPGPSHWLCDVVRMLDAVDEASSTIKVKTEGATRFYSFLAPTNLIFRKDIIGSARIFRLKYAWTNVFADDGVKVACKEAKVLGVRFESLSPNKWAANY